MSDPQAIYRDTMSACRSQWYILPPEMADFRHEDVYACSHLAAIDAPSQVMLLYFDKASGHKYEGPGLKAGVCS
jgi:hypothetical protein